jgi:Xaa-Pro aminopeptidase
MRVMDEKKFEQGFIHGWSSVIGHAMQVHEIPSPPIQLIGSKYIHGLMEGIEAAKKEILADSDE